MEYRNATLDDVEELTQMRINYLLDDMGFLSEEKEKAIRKQLPIYYKKHLNKDMFAYLAIKDEKIIGTVYLVIHEKPANPNFIYGKIGEVLSVLTVKEYRHQGVASVLMKQMISDAKKLGLDYIELHATEDGYPLYKKLGFVEEINYDVPMKYPIH